MNFSQGDHAFVKVGRASPEVVQVSHNRLLVVIIMFALGFLTVSARLFEITLFHETVDPQAVDFSAPERTTVRADIVDRNGILLASNLGTASLYANPKVIMDAKEAAEKIASVLPDLNKREIYERLTSDKSFVWIKRNLTPEEQYLTNSLGIPGLAFEQEERRVYPHQYLLSHVLGFVDVDGHGLSGVEKQFDSYLTDETSTEPLQLTIDVRVQDIVRKALSDQVKAYRAAGATGIVMDVSTGEVISMVSLPDFDPNNPGVATADEKFNRATLGVYEMGSTFKTFNMAMALESGRVHMTDSYDVSRPLQAARFVIHDFHPFKGSMTFPEIFMHSSNIGSAKIVLDVGEDFQRKFLERLGLLSRLDIELPETASPLYPSNWSKISSMTISYGHGISVTPLHVLHAITALVNGGTLYPATLVRQSDQGFVRGATVVTKKTSDDIRKLLRLVVEYGTGGRANVPEYLVGGKTGSADKINANGRYKGAGMIASFVGVFPMNKPRYAILVMVDEPKADKGYTTGGVVAAPVAGDIIAKIGPILGVSPVDSNTYEIKHEFWYDNAQKEPEIAATQTF